MPLASSEMVLGILVGGQGKRMGGVQKALLRAPDGVTLVERLAQLGRAAGLEVVLCGQVDLGSLLADVPRLPDAVPARGPLSGLAALFAHAHQRRVIALACDMPYVNAQLLERLSSHAPEAALVAPRDPETGKWQALFARYDSPKLTPVLDAALAAGQHSFQQLFARVHVTELALTEHEHTLLRDWDTPADVAASAADSKQRD